MEYCLETALNTKSVVVRNSTVQRVNPRSPESLEGRNSLITFSNRASKESIGIYTKKRCQWSGCLIKKSLEKGDMIV